MKLDQLNKQQVLELDLDTGIPLVYEIGTDGRVLSKEVRR
jgi:bisphosphoglycerate-dependent phosphoglycerate mutase